MAGASAETSPDKTASPKARTFRTEANSRWTNTFRNYLLFSLIVKTLWARVPQEYSPVQAITRDHHPRTGHLVRGSQPSLVRVVTAHERLDEIPNVLEHQLNDELAQPSEIRRRPTRHSGMASDLPAKLHLNQSEKRE